MAKFNLQLQNPTILEQVWRLRWPKQYAYPHRHPLASMASWPLLRRIRDSLPLSRPLLWRVNATATAGNLVRLPPRSLLILFVGMSCLASYPKSREN